MKNILLKGLLVSASIFLITSSVSAMTCTNLTKPLSRGLENSEVLSLQQFLFDSGYLTVKPNGFFGNGTVTALKKFQIANGMSPVGTVGPKTRGKVKEVSCESLDSKKSSTSIINKSIQATTTVDSVLSKKTEGGFIEIAGEYDNFNKLIGIGGKLAYVASKNTSRGTSNSVVVFDGKEISSKYDGAGGLIKVGNKIAYLATKKNVGTVVVYDGSEIFPEQCSSINMLVSVNNKAAFNCTKKDGTAAMFLDKIEVIRDKRYGLAVQSSPLDLDGKLAYQVGDSKESNTSKSTFLVDGVAVNFTDHPFINQSYTVNGKLLLSVRSPIDNSQNYLTYNGVNFAKGYDAIDSSVYVNGKIVVIGRKAIGNIYTMFIDGELKNTGYDMTSGAIEVGGKLAYFAKKGDKSLILYDGKEVGKEYDSVGIPYNVNNKLAFIAKKDGKSFIVIEK